MSSSLAFIWGVIRIACYSVCRVLLSPLPCFSLSAKFSAADQTAAACPPAAAARLRAAAAGLGQRRQNHAVGNGEPGGHQQHQADARLETGRQGDRETGRQTIPTRCSAGFAIKMLTLDQVVFEVKELGGMFGTARISRIFTQWAASIGNEKLRRYWDRYYQGAQGLVRFCGGSGFQNFTLSTPPFADLRPQRIGGGHAGGAAGVAVSRGPAPGAGQSARAAAGVSGRGVGGDCAGTSRGPAQRHRGLPAEERQGAAPACAQRLCWQVLSWTGRASRPKVSRSPRF